MNNIDEYLDFTDTTAIYPGAGQGKLDEMAYLGLGLGGEAGELMEVCKKILRDHPQIDWGDRVVDALPASLDDKVLGELADVVWYWARLCKFFGFAPSEVLDFSKIKLNSRSVRGVISGSGDNR